MAWSMNEIIVIGIGVFCVGVVIFCLLKTCWAPKNPRVYSKNPFLRNVVVIAPLAGCKVVDGFRLIPTEPYRVREYDLTGLLLSRRDNVPEKWLPDIKTKAELDGRTLLECQFLDDYPHCMICHGCG